MGLTSGATLAPLCSTRTRDSNLAQNLSLLTRPVAVRVSLACMHVLHILRLNRIAHRLRASAGRYVEITLSVDELRNSHLVWDLGPRVFGLMV